MRALTIRREWAWLIAEGHKRIENRSWSTQYRGPLAIHAGKRGDPSAAVLCERLGIQLPDQLVAGAVIAVVDLVDVVPLDGLFADELRADPFAVGPFCWRLDNVRKLREPVTVLGRLGLFSVPSELVAGN